MLPRVLLLSSLVLFPSVTAACTSADPPAAVRHDAIVSGARETGYPEVVALYWSSSPTEGGLCSATVIGPYAVLTAKHCVFRDTGAGYAEVPTRDMVVVVGHDLMDMSSIVSTHAVYEMRTTAGMDIDSDVEDGNDIALLLLDAAIDVTPRGFATSGPSTGGAIEIIGFGRTSSGSDASGVKYRGTTTVDRVGMRLFETNGTSWTCQGDSGGPAIDAAGDVTGITSFGFGDCRLPFSYFTRVAAHRALIEDALEFVPPCRPRAETCNDVDDDCDGMTDENGCATVGELCTTDDDCADGACEDVGGEMICVRQCFPDDPLGCAADQHCEPTACGIGRCVVGAPGTAANGTECTADTECASGWCAELSATLSRCAVQCVLATPVCAGGELCEMLDASSPPAAECGACIPETLSDRPRPFGSACAADAQCESGDCADEGFCTRACASHAECAGDFHCESGACARGAPIGAGGACTVADECTDGLTCESGACTAGGGSSGGGCTVSTAPRTDAPALALLALAAAMITTRARRRR